MVKPLDGATLGAIADRSRIIVRNFVLFNVKDSEGAPQLFGFTDYGEDVALDILDGVTGVAVNRSYAGDHAPLLALDPIPMKVGLEVDTTQVLLNPLHPAVLSMHRGHDCRNAPVQIHRAYLSTVSMLPVALPPLLVNPERRGRLEPRCIKRRPKQYDLMNRPRDTLRAALKKPPEKRLS